MKTHQLTKAEQAHIIRLAKRIFDYRLSVPVILFLDMMKYVSFYGSQAMVFFGPILTIFIKSDPYYRMAELMQDRNNIELLLKEIEKLEFSDKA
ncbi:MAG: hypothetical protein CMF96_11505 [Candidatus Marinimicrobia bacterium]|nr:hypothetical protein [Candidatus Neomarinimicrobiota bacterium]|tara:strand:+ start:702 stop:983 length:282 start_codon:yes stop_codon:yes gene_type:complete